MKGNFPFKRWVHELDYHITLTFLGSAQEEKLVEATSLVGDALEVRRLFQLSFKV